MTFSSQTPAQEWKAMRLLRLLYVRLAREFVIEAPPCDELDTGIDVPSHEDLNVAQQWFRTMDQLIQVHQLRQFLQTTTGVNEETLIALIQHHLGKAERTDSDRDKVDFLLVQLLNQTAPSQTETRVDIAFVASGLENVLGAIDATVPNWLSPLENLVTEAKTCQTLNALFSSGILESGRKIKIESGQNYFEPAALVVFTRFNFLLRRVFFHAMHQDINAILDGLRMLESRGIATLDARAAQFSEEEGTAQLRMICQSWKVMFQAEYSSGQPMRILADLRNVVEATLAATAPEPEPVESAPRAMAAAAGGRSSANRSEVPEFDVAGGQDTPSEL
jgi:hypothetical protein